MTESDGKMTNDERIRLFPFPWGTKQAITRDGTRQETIIDADGFEVCYYHGPMMTNRIVDTVNALANERDQLKSRVERLESALMPFATTLMHEQYGDVVIDKSLFRNAQNVLFEEKK